MRLKFLNCKKTKKYLIVEGQILDRNRLGGIPCNIYCATGTDTTFKIDEKLKSANNQGNFKVKIELDKSESIYFAYFGYTDLELKINKLNP